jgi:hypothetical protein
MNGRTPLKAFRDGVPRDQQEGGDLKDRRLILSQGR